MAPLDIIRFIGGRTMRLALIVAAGLAINFTTQLAVAVGIALLGGEGAMPVLAGIGVGFLANLVFLQRALRKPRDAGSDRA